MKREFFKKNLIIFACTLIALIFLFKNLGNVYFWSDEAYSAVCAKNTALFGYPKSFDGRNIAQHYWLIDGQWRFAPFNRTTPWLHLYMGAASFLLFGFNNFAARFPFALTGFATIICLFLFLRKYEKNPFIVNTALVLLTFCIPFYLHMRQCRYYAPAALFTLLATWGYLDFFNTGRKRYFIIATTFLFLSLQSAIAVFILTVIIHSLLRFDKERFKNLVLCGAAVALIAVPHAIQLRLWERPEDLLNWETTMTARLYTSRIFCYNMHFNNYVFPYVLVFVFLVWAGIKGYFNKKAFGAREHLSFLLILCTINLFFLAYVAPQHFRMVLHHVPEVCILGAYVIYFFRQRMGKYAALILLSIISTSNVLHVLPYQISKIPGIHQAVAGAIKNVYHWDIWGWMLWKMSLRAPVHSYQAEYVYEITHDYDGPIEGIAKYLNTHAGTDDIVKISYGDYALQFYTDRFIIPRGEIKNDVIPDWLILRGDYWKTRRQNPPLDQYFAPLIEKEFEKIVIDYPEINWENNPEPEYHKYQTVVIDYRQIQPVVIYRRKKPYPELSRQEKSAMINKLWEQKSY
ncbi:MAG: glycosyltransferase family 39 protein [Candidatus Schekmanbacteria bacterium]|nr:glycosyltransferase family 39 protein [Candidatus Schekmanbacteria bacterium]